MKAYKGFDKDLKCRGFQFEVGKTYEEDKAELCSSGFHACEAPLDVLGYYPPNSSRYCEVELDDASAERHSIDTKVVGKKIKIGAEIGIAGLVKAHVDYVREEVKDCTDGSSGYDAKIGSSGRYAQIGSSGYDAKIGSSGRYAQIGSSGDDAKIGSSGYAAQIGSSGDAAKIGSSGDDAKIGSSGRYAKIGSSGRYAKIGSSGRYAQIGSSGRYAQIGSSGDDAKIECEADHAVVACVGKRGRCRAALGAWITLAEYGEYNGEGCPCICVKSFRIDGRRHKPGVWYTLRDGKVVEVKE